MCCRYYIDRTPEVNAYLAELNRSPLLARMTSALGKGLISEGEVRPSEMVPVLAPARNRARAVFPMLWGVPCGGRLLINCRSETAGQKPLWRADWQAHRCAIPAAHYFEWEHVPTASGKTKAGAKYQIRPLGQQLTFLAGLYHMETSHGITYPVFSVLTREPAASIRFIHDRMPLMLPEALVDAWITPETPPEEILPAALTEVEYQNVPGAWA